MQSDSIENFDKIEDYLYLGSYAIAENINVLNSINIKRVLSINNFQIGNKDPQILYKWFKIEDRAEEDLLSILIDCYQFINDGQERMENIFVHCKAGISRSGAVITAFIMKKYKYTCNEALETVKLKRDINPNWGFIQQLMVYGEMNCVLNVMHKPYRRLLFMNILNKWWRIQWLFFSEAPYEKSLCKNFNNFIGKLKNNEEPNTTCNYNCINCKSVLFEQMHVIENELNLDKTEDKNFNCNNIYIEPQRWMYNIFMTLDIKGRLQHGDINCYFCSKLIGKYNFSKNIPFKCYCCNHSNVAIYLFIKIFKNKVNYNVS